MNEPIRSSTSGDVADSESAREDVSVSFLVAVMK